jgi:hypothetical protein
MAVRTLTLDVCHVQGRRIRCGWCEQPFTYVLEGRKKHESYGVALVSTDEALQRGALEKARKALVKIGGAPDQGEARCPHCSRYQAWMLRRSRIAKTTKWGLWFGIPPALWFLIKYLFSVRGTPLSSLLVPGAACLLLAGVGVGIGRLRSLPSAPVRDGADPRAATDDEVRDLLTLAAREGEDPLHRWYLTLHDQAPADALVITMGFLDRPGDGFFPADLRSAKVLADPGPAG